MMYGRGMVVHQMSLVLGRVFMVFLQEPFFAPERHRHQTRHVERRAGRGDRADNPDQPTDGNVSR